MGLTIDTDSVVYHSSGSVFVNGKSFQAPLYVVKLSKMHEISTTLYGRDGNTSVTKLSKDTLMTIKNNKPDPSKDAPEPVPTPTPVKVENTHPVPAPAPVDPAPVPPVVVDNKKPANGGLPSSLLNALDWMVEHREHPELVRDAIKNNWDKDRLDREVQLKNMEGNYPSLPGAWRVDSKVSNQFTARFALSCGIKPEFLEKKLNKELVENAYAQPQLGLKESLMLCANSNGGSFNGHSDTQNLSKFVKRLVVNNAFSTIDYPNLMHQVAQWKMEEAWLLDPPFAPSMALAVSNKDFRPTGHIKPKGGTMWNGLNKEGKIEHGSFGEEDKYETKLSTVAQILTFKRPDIINDNIGWIQETLDLMVEGAMMVPDYQLVNLIYNALSAGVTTAGVSSFTLPLTFANLETVYDAIKRRDVVKGDKIVKARQQTKYMLMVTANLEKEAWEIINQERFVQGPSGDYVGERNYWRDKFEVKVFDQLDNVTYNSGAEDNAWGLVPMNTKYSPFAITYLNGQTRPTTEVVDLPADELGFGVRGYWDVNMNYRPVENDKLQATAFSFPANAPTTTT